MGQSLGRAPARGALVSADINDGIILTAALADSAVTAAKIAIDTIEAGDVAPNAIGNSEMADDAVGIAELSATGTASSSTYLRGDNSWAAAGSPSITDNGNATAMTIDVSENVTYTGNIIMPTNKKVQQKGAFMQSSTHQSIALGN